MIRQAGWHRRKQVYPVPADIMFAGTFFIAEGFCHDHSFKVLAHARRRVITNALHHQLSVYKQSESQRDLRLRKELS